MSRKPCDSYIRLNKKISNKFLINQIEILCAKWGLSAQEVCYKLIHEGILREVKNRGILEELINPAK